MHQHAVSRTLAFALLMSGCASLSPPQIRTVDRLLESRPVVFARRPLWLEASTPPVWVNSNQMHVSLAARMGCTDGREDTLLRTPLESHSVKHYAPQLGIGTGLTLTGWGLLLASRKLDPDVGPKDHRNAGIVAISAGAVLLAHLAYVLKAGQEHAVAPEVLARRHLLHQATRICELSASGPGTVLAHVAKRTVTLAKVPDGRDLLIEPRKGATRLCSNEDEAGEISNLEFVTQGEPALRFALGLYPLAECVLATTAHTRLDALRESLAERPGAERLLLSLRSLRELYANIRSLPERDPDRAALLRDWSEVVTVANKSARAKQGSDVEAALQLIRKDLEAAIQPTADALLVAEMSALNGSMPEDPVDVTRRTAAAREHVSATDSAKPSSSANSKADSVAPGAEVSTHEVLYSAFVARAKLEGAHGYHQLLRLTETDSTTHACFTNTAACPFEGADEHWRKLMLPAVTAAIRDVEQRERTLNAAVQPVTLRQTPARLQAATRARADAATALQLCTRPGPLFALTEPCAELVETDQRVVAWAMAPTATASPATAVTPATPAAETPAPAVSAPVALSQLQAQIETIANQAGGNVGVSVLHVQSGHRVGVGGQTLLPLFSVFKLPLAVAVLDAVAHGKLSIEQRTVVTAEDIVPGVDANAARWNPLPTQVDIRKLLELSLIESDNTASDVLLRLLGGPAALTQRLRAWGFLHIDVRASTKQIIEGQPHPNYATADDLSRLLRDLQQGNILPTPELALLWQIMRRSQTGVNRMRGALPETTPVLDKTGTGSDGTATHDVGIVTLPDSRGDVAISVLISNSKLPRAEQERLIAVLTRAVYDAFATSGRTY